MSPLKRELVAAATAALGVAGCSAAERAESSPAPVVAPPPPTPMAPEPETVELPAGEAAGPSRRAQPTTGEPIPTGTAVPQEVFGSCGASCGASCGGEPDDQDDDEGE